jgi:hypothetical protein
LRVSRYRLGIDFGTSHTVAVVQRPDGRVEPLLFDASPLLVSAVYAEYDGRLSVGRDAVHSARVEPGAYEPQPKRRIDDHAVLLGSVELRVTDLIAAVLGRVQQEATRVIGRPADEVVLTYPAGWGARRRAVLLDAARAAGLGTPRLVPEPLAAAWYFSEGLGHRVPPGGVLVVYDFGAGTFDAAVVRRGGPSWDVLAVDGLDDVGGLDLDNAIVDSFGARYGREHPEVWQRLTNPQTVADRRYRRMLWEDVRAAKEKLSRSSTAGLPLPLLDVDVHLTRESFEELARPWLERTVATTLGALGRAGVGRRELVGVLLAGGSSRIPLAGTLLHQRLGIAPTVTDQPELVVAQGSLLAPGEQRPDLAATAGVRADGAGPTFLPPAAAVSPVSATPVPAAPVTAVPVTAVPVASVPVASVPVTGVPVTDVPAAAGAVAVEPPARERNRWGYRLTIALAGLVALGIVAAGAATASTWLRHGGAGDRSAATGNPGGDGTAGPGGSGSAGPGGSAGPSGSPGAKQQPGGGQSRGSGAPGAGGGTSARPGPVTEATFVHKATSGNSTYDYTDLDNALTNNNPAAVVFVTPNWSPPGGGGAYDDRAIGVWYHDGRWAIYNQDQSPIPAGAAFNVHVWSGPSATVLVHSATSANTAGDYTNIDNSASNSKLSAIVWVTPNYAPALVYDNHAIGVWYNSGKWAVFHQDVSDMAVGTAYNVAIGSHGAKAAYVHTASAGNSTGDYTDLDNAALNGHPNAMVFVTPNWNPAGGSGVYDNHNIGVWYHDGHWSVFHQDQTPIPAGAAFTIVAYGG